MKAFRSWESLGAGKGYQKGVCSIKDLFSPLTHLMVAYVSMVNRKQQSLFARQEGGRLACPVLPSQVGHPPTPSTCRPALFFSLCPRTFSQPPRLLPQTTTIFPLLNLSSPNPAQPSTQPTLPPQHTLREVFLLLLTSLLPSTHTRSPSITNLYPSQPISREKFSQRPFPRQKQGDTQISPSTGRARLATSL